MEGDRMFLHILVPLDGSRLAETALSTAGWLAGDWPNDAPGHKHRMRTAAPVNTRNMPFTRPPVLLPAAYYTYAHRQGESCGG